MKVKNFVRSVCEVTLALLTSFLLSNIVGAMDKNEKLDLRTPYVDFYLFPEHIEAFNSSYSAQFNVLIIGETENCANEVAERIDRHLREYEKINGNNYENGKVYKASKSARIEFVKFTTDKFLSLSKDERKKIVELIDSTDFVFYVCRNLTDIHDFPTLKTCYNTVNRLWFEDICKGKYTEYDASIADDSWHISKERKEVCGGHSYHYYWMTFIDGTPEYFFKEIRGRSSANVIAGWVSRMVNGRELLPIICSSYALSAKNEWYGKLCPKKRYSIKFGNSCLGSNNTSVDGNNVINQKKNLELCFGSSMLSGRVGDCWNKFMGMEEFDKAYRSKGFQDVLEACQQEGKRIFIGTEDVKTINKSGFCGCEIV